MLRTRAVRLAPACALVLCIVVPCLSAEDPESKSVFGGGDWSAQMRYRVETVEEDRPLHSATASTLRTRAGFETNPQLLLGVMLEVEDVHAIGAEKFNSTTNGHTDFSVVPDPDSTELNQAYLSLRRGGLRARAGRQSIVLDNARFVGDVDFRQNQQTYDALSLQYSTPGGSRLTYGYLSRVRRFFGDDHALGDLDMRTHVLNYSLGRLNGDRLTAYAYLLDFEQLAVGPPLSSTQTFGASYDGGLDMATRKLLYRLEYANQSDYADNAGPADAWYANAEIGLRLANQWVATAGVEVLSGDGAYGFQTPLATLHKFNGFADIFAAATPPDGIEDRYVRAYVPISGLRLTVTWHDFRAEDGDLDYGSEIDAEIGWRLTSYLLVGAKYADYDAHDFAVDTRKAWLWIQADF